MKTLIEKSIELSGYPTIKKTIFDANENTPERFKFDIAKLSGRSSNVWFNYEEDGFTKEGEKFIARIPSGLDTQGVKDFIIAEINSRL